MKVLNDLYDYGLKIYQNTDNFKFSLDSLLLSEFVTISPKVSQVLDLCSGNAPIPLILAQKYNVHVTGVEIQKEIYKLAQESIAYNHLEPKITMLNINALDINNYFPGNNFDIITCNPPFFKVNPTTLTSPNNTKAIARHEITITLADIFRISSENLKANGEFYLVHRSERLTEIISYAQEYHLILKKAIFIYSNYSKDAIMVLFKFVKNANPGTKVYSYLVNRDATSYQNVFQKFK